MKFSSKFISASKKYNTYSEHISAPLLRKSFNLNDKPEKAEITICALGFYRLFINGKEITKGFLAPYISNPDHIIYYDNYDIAPLLKQGENVIGIILGNGMQNASGGFVWDFDKDDWRSAPKTALCVEVEYQDGSSFEFEADESFKCSDSPIWFDDLRSGCFYNALKEQNGWCEAGFDDSSWKNSFFCEKPRGEQRLCKADPIVAERRIAPVSVKAGTITNNHFGTREDHCTPEIPESFEGFIYDFGINTTGVFEFKISGAEPGRRIEFFTAEMLDEEGKLDPHTFANFYPKYYGQRDIYICKGGEESFIPSFTYHGYRYCLVTGLKESEATPEALTYIVAHSDLKEKGGFECSDSTLNTLQAMVRNSDLSNFHYFPTDCPHREKNGWTGDASVSCEHILLNLGAEKSYTEWLNNIRKAMREDGALPGIVPTGKWGYHWGNGPMWDSVLTTLPYYMYKFTGDISVLEENADAILRYVNYLSNRRDEKGLIAIGLGDWLHVNRYSDKSKCPLIVTDSIVSMLICKRAAFIFDQLGKTAQRDFANTIYEQFRTAIRKNLVSFTKMSVLSNSQTSLSLAIYCGVFDEAEIPFAVKRLVEVIHDCDDKLDCGFIGGRCMFRVLSKYGYSSLAYKIVARPEFPSYRWWIDQGATALWEDFYPEKRNSLNHHFWGDISSWFIQDIAGIHLNPDCDDVTKVDIIPSFIDELSYAKAWHEAPNGKISVNWSRNEDGTVDIKIDIPESSHGTLYLPDGWITHDCQHPFDGVDFIKLEKSNTVKVITKADYKASKAGKVPCDIFKAKR